MEVCSQITGAYHNRYTPPPATELWDGLRYMTEAVVLTQPPYSTGPNSTNVCGTETSQIHGGSTQDSRGLCQYLRHHRRPPEVLVP